MTGAHRSHVGAIGANVDLAHETCLCCGRSLSAHRGDRNESISCVELAERAEAIAAAASCTTHEAASVAIGARA